METVALLLLIVGVAAVFIWLRRTIGDDWPPPSPEAASPLAAVTAVQGEHVIADSHDLEAGAAPAVILPAYSPPAAESVSLRTTVPENVVASATIVAGRPASQTSAVVAEPAPPAQQPEFAAIEPVAQVAKPLLLGGLALFMGALLTTATIPEGQRGGIFALTLLGATTMLLGVQASMRGRLPGWLNSLLIRLGSFLHVGQGQVVMLLLTLPLAFLARLAAGNEALAHQPAIALLAWLLAIALAIAGTVSRETSTGSSRSAFDRWDYLLMGGLFIAALLARGIATAQFPNTFSGDEGSAGLYGLLQLQGQVNNPFVVGWFSFPSLYFAIQGIAIGLGGQTVEAVRLTSAVAGALSVVALYALGRAMFNRTTAILAAAYLAASHYHIHMSRIALNNVWDGLFGTLAILGLWAGWKSNRRSAFILCGLALGLGQYFYVAIRVLPIVFLVWAAIAWWRQREQFRQRLPGLVVAAGIALVVFLPLGLYFAEKPDEFQAPLNRVTIFGDWLDNELALGQRTTLEIIVDQALAGVMGFTSEPLRLLYNPGSPLLLTGAATLFILGILWALLNIDLRYVLLLLPMVASIAANAVSQDSPASQRYILVMPLVALFVTLPLGEAAAWVREKRPQYQRTAVGAAAVVMLIVMLFDLNYYFNKVYDTYVLGGGNTTAATVIATTLRDEEPAAQDVYFFGFPRMGYFSLSTIPFLAPQMRGQDIADPLTAPPDWSLTGPSLFVFLPERLGELALVEQAYPNGQYNEYFSPTGELLFAIYGVS